jgi:hypothetical protein
MTMLRMLRLLSVGFVLSSTVYLAGCSSSRDDTGEKPAPAKEKSEGEHGHKPGTHGGLIVAIGADSYHAEAVFEKGGVFWLYVLGKDESRVQEVELQTLSAHVKGQDDAEAVPFQLKPAPQEGDSTGKTSAFRGQLPKELQGRKVVVTIPNLRIGDERFRVPPIHSGADGHTPENVSPKIADQEEKQLYLTPGGKYTESDIKANGNQTASQKFKGFRASHDSAPAPGERICPVTRTRANPQCTWIVDGKTYQFCCPPCVDEFVQTAKTKPNRIKGPDEYIKK